MLIVRLLGTHANDNHHANVLPRRAWLLWFGIPTSGVHSSDCFKDWDGLAFKFEWE